MAQMNMVQAINSAMDIMLSARSRRRVHRRRHRLLRRRVPLTDGLQRKYGDIA